MTEEQACRPGNDEWDRASYENWEPVLRTGEDVSRALTIALDYRGDVTVATADGKSITGYVFNCAADRSDPYFEIYPKGVDQARRLRYREVVGLAFASFDPAAGRSWETWVKKYEEKKEALAEGRDIGNIEPEPMPLDD